MRYTFNRRERLKREQHIEALFREGKAFSFGGIRVVFRLVPAAEPGIPILAGVSVSKKNFKSSVQRQRIKRLLRECWRLQKPRLVPLVPEGRQLHLFLIYRDKVLPQFAVLQQSMADAAVRLETTVLAPPR